MPKHFSKSTPSVTPEQVVLKKGSFKFLIIGLVFLLTIGGVFLFLRPKSLVMSQSIPAGAMAYWHVSDAAGQMEALRASAFVQQISRLDFEGLLNRQGLPPEQVQHYVQMRQELEAFLASDVFKQFLGREAAVALYPAQENFSNGEWPARLSGVMLVLRPTHQARWTQMLAQVISQFSPEWKTEVHKYKNVPITSLLLDKTNVKVFYGRIHDLLVLSVDERLIHRTVDTVEQKSGSMGQDENFKTISTQFYDQSSGEFWLTMPVLRNFLKEYWQSMVVARSSDEPAIADTDWDVFFSEFDGVKVSGASYLAQNPLRFKWLVAFDPAQSAPSLKRLNNCVIGNNPTISLVPQTVKLYQWVGCMDVKSWLEDYKQHLQKTTNSPSAIEMPWAKWEQSLGINLEDDILPLIGDQFGWFFQGVEPTNFFPVIQAGLMIKVHDSSGVDELIRKLAATPITTVQTDEYRGVKFHYVAFPLITALKPSYALINGCLILTTSDRLIKQSIDASQDPSLSLAHEDSFKSTASLKTSSGYTLSFVKINALAAEAKSLIQWADQWLNQRLEQAVQQEMKLNQEEKELSLSLETKAKEMDDIKTKLQELRKSNESLKAQQQAASVVNEAQNTLSQEGKILESTVDPSLQPQQMITYQQSQISAMELQLGGLDNEITSSKSRQNDLKQKKEDVQQQKAQAQEQRYWVDHLVVPVLTAVESLMAQTTSSQINDGIIESETVLIVK